MGHYLYRPGGSSTGHEEEKQLATALGFDSYACHKFDGGFAPGVRPAARGNGDEKDRGEVEGEARLTYLRGWSLLAWWDRGGDSRFASNSLLAARGEFSFEEMLAVGTTYFPEVMKRQRKPLRLVQWDEKTKGLDGPHEVTARLRLVLREIASERNDPAIAEADALITALNEWACKAPVV